MFTGGRAQVSPRAPTVPGRQPRPRRSGHDPAGGATGPGGPAAGNAARGGVQPRAMSRPAADRADGRALCKSVQPGGGARPAASPGDAVVPRRSDGHVGAARSRRRADGGGGLGSAGHAGAGKFATGKQRGARRLPVGSDRIERAEPPGRRAAGAGGARGGLSVAGRPVALCAGAGGVVPALRRGRGRRPLRRPGDARRPGGPGGAARRPAGAGGGAAGGPGVAGAKSSL